MCKTPHFVLKNYTICVNLMKSYTLYVKLHILCNIKAVSFMYQLENFHLAEFFTQPAVVMVVTNIRCGTMLHELGQREESIKTVINMIDCVTGAK